MFNSNVYYMYHTCAVQEGTHKIEIINLKSLVSKKILHYGSILQYLVLIGSQKNFQERMPPNKHL